MDDGLGRDGPSSRLASLVASQGRADASGSVLLTQVLGAAKALGHDIEIPPLPIDEIPSENPLRAAILAWIAATGSAVPDEELAVELARADLMPIDLQRDVALLLFSAAAATTLQRDALAAIPATDLQWIYDHPEVGEALAQGVSNPDTRRLAALAALVDMPQSLAATALLLSAIEATRGSFTEHQAKLALGGLDVASLDPTTRSMLSLLLSADQRTTDADKVRLAAELVALGAGIPVPVAGPAPSFASAVEALLATGDHAPDAAALSAAVERAAILPLDLQQAIARIILAEAHAIDAANPDRLTPTSQQEALVSMLVATAAALPTLEKYNLYWRDAPEALRVGEWDPATRAGWVAHHAAIIVSARADPKDLARAAAMMRGAELAPFPEIPDLSFTDAYLAIAREGGFAVDEKTRLEVERASQRLAPDVRDAAALLMSASAESARLQRVAFSALTREERDYLRFEVSDLDALYAKGDLSPADLDRLKRGSLLAEKIDSDALTASGLLVASAASTAERMLSGKTGLRTLGEATPVRASVFDKILPWRTARAQDENCNLLPGLIDFCGEDVLLRLHYPTFTFGYTPAELVAASQMDGMAMHREAYTRRAPAQGVTVTQHAAGAGVGVFQGQGAVNPVSVSTDLEVYTCDTTVCMIYGSSQWGTGGEATTELLVITGSASTTRLPERATRAVCPAQLGQIFTLNPQGTPIPRPHYFPAESGCRVEEVNRYGAPTISIDLGGVDTYFAPVAMVHTNATIPVSVHIDVGGNDIYSDPSPLYDVYSPLLLQLGFNRGHPTQASAVFGGVAVLVDATGNDYYSAATRSQGFARYGLALLADLTGADTYIGGEYVQGATSDTFNLGAGILVDATPSKDSYTAVTGQAFGLGSIFLDSGGDDDYANQHDALGIPVVHLDVLPGGDLASFETREDNRIWLDGPASISVGIGIDTELTVITTPGDSDGYPDFVETALGTDPYDPTDNPQSNPTARVGAATFDEDRDGYPDYVERALSTDPKNPASYPAGFPSGIVVKVPTAVWGPLHGTGVPSILGVGQTVDPLDTADDNTNTEGFRGHDKILDLRLPVQNAGSIDAACTGAFYGNATAPVGIAPGGNILRRSPLADTDEESNAPRTTDNKIPGRCVHVSYQSNGAGESNGTLPGGSAPGTSYDAFTLRAPTGILAIGDVVPTTYADDYLVVIDLGGNDSFPNTAGGGLMIKSRPREREGTMSSDNVRSTFIAPSIVVNVDPATASAADALQTILANDKYENGTRDFAHGSYFGVLIDTAGDDSYAARDASQGSLGGILLDLDGSDTFSAGNLSQGAGLSATSFNDRVRDIPSYDAMSADGVGGVRIGVGARRSLPGILLDLGAAETGNKFSALAHSQGFARGFAGDFNPDSNSTRAQGLLAVLGETSDVYTAFGRYAQGVAGVEGVGILLDRGGNDKYNAIGRVSHGATISSMVNSEDTANSTTGPRPAAGVLLDLGGSDEYRWRASVTASYALRPERNQNTSITRSESAFKSDYGAAIYADVGIHIDTTLNPTAPGLLLDGVGGTGEDARNGALDSANFYVHLPTARLAIGKPVDNLYAREYAFVVDTGGNNQYQYSAGGLVRDYIGTMPQHSSLRSVTPTAPGAYESGLTLFPVNFLFDAGAGASNYKSSRSFSQGAGFFSVGIVADMGGDDVFRVEPTRLESLKSHWVTVQPLIDGAIGADWDGIPAQNITLAARDDPSQFHEWKLRLGNDERSLYLGIEGTTFAVGPDAPVRDTLVVDLDMARRREMWNDTSDRTGIDQVRFAFDSTTKSCVASDWSLNKDPPGDSIVPAFTVDEPVVGDTDIERLRFVANCRFTDDGKIFFEFRKDLVERKPVDRYDLSYCYADGVGFGVPTGAPAPEPSCRFPVSELGLFLHFEDGGAGYTGTGAAAAPARTSPFTYPPGATHVDGESGNAQQATFNISDEMEDWAVVGLAALGVDGVKANATRPTILGQGASLAGVGVLAMLGNGVANAKLEGGDRSLGYATFGGLSALIDLGGSDSYRGGKRVLGAADSQGVAVFFELEGHDNYVSVNHSFGWAPAQQASAAFIDLGGDDAYTGEPQLSAHLTEIPRAMDLSKVSTDDGNNVAWVQGGGAGADYRLADFVRDLVLGSLGNAIYKTSTYPTTFSVTKFDPVNAGHHGKGCTKDAVDRFTEKPILTGKVCFVAHVDTGNSYLNISQAPFVGALLTEGAVRNEVRSVSDAIAGVTTINVSAVDFFVDRQRVGTVSVPNVTDRDTAHFVFVFDSTILKDGIGRAKAVPVYTANVGPYGAMLFRESVPDEIFDTDPATETVYVNNPPQITLGLSPPFTGVANASYSPIGYGAAQSLTIAYNVSHDAGEERLNAFNGWYIPRDQGFTNTSFPCVGVPAPEETSPRLCSMMPFFYNGNGVELTTTPGRSSTPETETESVSENFKSAKTNVLNGPMAIALRDSFHFSIPTRSWLFPTSYTTEIIVSLEDGNNQDVKMGNAVWPLGYIRVPSNSTMPDPSDPDSIYKAASALAGPSLGTVNDQLGEVTGANPGDRVAAILYYGCADPATQSDPACKTTGASGFQGCSGPTVGIPCDQLRGQYGTGSIRGCNARPSQTLQAGLWDAFMMADMVIYDGSIRKPETASIAPIPESTPVWGGTNSFDDSNVLKGLRVCDGAFRWINYTAHTAGGPVDGIGPLVESVSNTLAEATSTVVGFQRCQSDLPAGTPPLPPEAPECVATRDVLVLETGQGTREEVLNFTDFYFDVNIGPTTKPDARWFSEDGTDPNKIRVVDGTLIIPRTYKIQLDWRIVPVAPSKILEESPPSEVFYDIMTTLAQTFYTNTDDELNAIPDQPVNHDEPIPFLRPKDRVRDALNGQRDAGSLVLKCIDTLQPCSLPVTYFQRSAGPADMQPRLAIRTPTEPNTTVNVRFEDPVTGAVVYDVATGVKREGDIPGSPTRDGAVVNEYIWRTYRNNGEPPLTPAPTYWTAKSGTRWSQHAITFADSGIEDGLYYLNVSGNDGASESYTRDRVIIDKTPPQTLILTPKFAGGGSLVGGGLPIRWSAVEKGSGVEMVRVYARNNSTGEVQNISTWHQLGTFPASVKSVIKQKVPGNTHLILTVGVDRARNVEGSSNAPDLEAAFVEGFNTKVKRGDSTFGYRKIFVDEGDPRITSVKIDGGRLLNFEGADFSFVKAGQPVTFSICTLDAESDIEKVVLSLDHVDPLSGTLTSATMDATLAGGCDAKGRLFTTSAWHTQNANQTRFPEGIWASMFEVYDKAGNSLRVPAGNLILDHKSPNVTVESPVYPTGQTAVKPGDLVKIRLSASDNFGVDEAAIRVDASALAKGGGAIPAKAIRVNGVILHEATFTIDQPSIENRVYTVIVSVPDFAGNFTNVSVPIPVNFKPFNITAGSVQVTRVTHNSALVNWTTDQPTTAYVKFGTSAATITSRSAQSVNASLKHSVLVEGLAPSTHYLLRPVALSSGGGVKEGDIVEIDTATALFLAPVSPKAGDAVHDVVKVSFKGGLLDSTDFVSYTLEVRDNASKPWTFITTATRQGELHELSWNSSRFLDGTGYELQITAKAGRDVARIVVGPITSDNTPPGVLVLSPLLATNDTTPNITAEAGDSLSGLASSPARLFVDGVPVNATLVTTPLQGGRVRISHTFLEPLPMGMRTLELRVTDKAGNVAREQWRVAVDAEPPVVTVNPTRFSPGVSAAKQGGTVTLNLSIKDLSGVAHVIAATGNLSSQAETRLVKLVNTDNWVGTFTVSADDPLATKSILITAVDLAGNVRTLSVDVLVDNTPPRPAATRHGQITHTSAVIEISADEPILVNGTATAPISPAVTAATRELAPFTMLEFKGMLPSRTYQYKLVVTDRAGNAVPLQGSVETLKDVRPPSSVGDLSVVDLLNGTLRFTWKAATDDVGVAGYRVYRSEDGVTFSQRAEVQETTFDDAGLPYEKTYVYRVAAYDHGGNEGPADARLSVAATAAPTLTVGVVTPTVGSAATIFRYSVTYAHPGGVEPSYVRLILDGVTQNMTKQSGDAKSGLIYIFETRLAPHKRDAPHTYAFEASDGRYTVRTPEDGSVIRGPLVSGDVLSGEDVGGFASFAQRVPFGGLAGVAVAVAIALGVAATLGRRAKKGGSK